MSDQHQAVPESDQANVRKLTPQSALIGYRVNKFVTHTWQPPDVPTDATTDDLVGIQEHFWTWIPTAFGADAAELNSQPEISRDGLRCLLRLSFLASLETDEQRPTRGKLYVPARHEPKTSAVFSFEEPKPLDSPKRIARLCPTLISDDAALLVAEFENRLVSTGIAYLDDQHADYKLLDLPRDWTGRRGGLLVSLLAPGEIRMRQGYLCDYTLRGNVIVGRSPVATTGPVEAWLKELHSNLLSRLPTSVITRRPPVLLEDDPAVFSVILSRVLNTATRLRHGGAIAVLPSQGGQLITIKHTTTSQPLTEIVDRLYCTWAEALDKEDKPDGTRVIGRFETLRHSLLTTAEALGGLTATDGCVVLNRSMRLIGFGGIIDVEQAKLGSQLVWGGSPSDPSMTEQALLERFGTRHRSAYLLCRALPNTIAFVVSQDGDLRVFASDNERVYYFDSLSP